MIGGGFVAPPYVMSEADARAGRGGVSYDLFDALAKYHGITYEIQYNVDYINHGEEKSSTNGSTEEVRFLSIFPPYLYM